MKPADLEGRAEFLYAAPVGRASKSLNILVGHVGLEPTTYGLRVRYPFAENHRKIRMFSLRHSENYRQKTARFKGALRDTFTRTTEGRP